MSEPNPKQRYGDLKVPIGLVPPVALVHAGAAMRNGAEKYGPYNFRDAPVECMTYVHAALRHLLAYLDGEQTSADAGVHHLGHVIACCAILLDGEALGTLIDNRPAKGAAARILAEYEHPAASAMKGGTPEDFEREVLRPKARAEQREAVEIPDDVRVAPLQGTPEGYEQLKYAPEYEDLDRESHWLSRVRLRPGGAWGAWCRAKTRQHSRAEALAAASSAPDPDPVGDALAKARDEILGVGPEDAP